MRPTGRPTVTPAALPLRCPGAANDEVNLVRGSLPIEVDQGMRRVSRNVTQFTAIMELTLDVAVDEIDQLELSNRLGKLWGTPVVTQVMGGSALVLVSAVLNASHQQAFTDHASRISDGQLSEVLDMPARVLRFAVSAVNVSIPYDATCEPG